MPIFQTQIIRIAADTTSKENVLDLNTSAEPQAWWARNLVMQVGVFAGQTLLDVSDIESVTINLKDLTNLDGLPLATKTITSFDNTTTLTTWQAGTQQHFAVDFTADDLSFGLTNGVRLVHLVITAVTTGGQTGTICVGTLNIIDDGGNSPSTTPVNAITIATGDARYARLGAEMEFDEGAITSDGSGDITAVSFIGDGTNLGLASNADVQNALNTAYAADSDAMNAYYYAEGLLSYPGDWYIEYLIGEYGASSGGTMDFDSGAITSDGSGHITAVSFIGDGSGLTGLPSRATMSFDGGKITSDGNGNLTAKTFLGGYAKVVAGSGLAGRFGVSTAFLAVDCSSNNALVTLPSLDNSDTIPGQRFTIKRIDSSANTLTIRGAGNYCYIDGIEAPSNQYQLTNQFSAITFVSYDQGYYIESRYLT
jgi:hypothetical protein